MKSLKMKIQICTAWMYIVKDNVLRVVVRKQDPNGQQLVVLKKSNSPRRTFIASNKTYTINRWWSTFLPSIILSYENFMLSLWLAGSRFFRYKIGFFGHASYTNLHLSKSKSLHKRNLACVIFSISCLDLAHWLSLITTHIFPHHCLH